MQMSVDNHFRDTRVLDGLASSNTGISGSLTSTCLRAVVEAADAFGWTSKGVVDFGSGTGRMVRMALLRIPSVAVTGVESDPHQYELSLATVGMLPQAMRLRADIRLGDFTQVRHTAGLTASFAYVFDTGMPPRVWKACLATIMKTNSIVGLACFRDLRGTDSALPVELVGRRVLSMYGSRERKVCRFYRIGTHRNPARAPS
jgi:SAM-dependent methyltransferase